LTIIGVRIGDDVGSEHIIVNLGTHNPSPLQTPAPEGTLDP
jgi:hypothetical protein